MPSRKNAKDKEKSGSSYEQVKQFDNKQAAAQAACDFVRLDPKNPDKDLVLVEGTLSSSEASGRTVGVGFLRPAGNTLPVIRLDYDEEKGMHFNAVDPKDQSLKLAACWPKTDVDFNNHLNRMAGSDASQILSGWTEAKTYPLTPSEFHSLTWNSVKMVDPEEHADARAKHGRLSSQDFDALERYEARRSKK